ncbi:hypothetical protein Pla52nx_004161 [Stieleria varia]|uniref:hypothetical protein n=1 Tax=Stieleria varia TaxID=2528005 RepID=UPI00313BDB83
MDAKLPLNDQLTVEMLGTTSQMNSGPENGELLLRGTERMNGSSTRGNGVDNAVNWNGAICFDRNAADDATNHLSESGDALRTEDPVPLDVWLARPEDG